MYAIVHVFSLYYVTYKLDIMLHISWMLCYIKVGCYVTYKLDVM